MASSPDAPNLEDQPRDQDDDDEGRRVLAAPFEDVEPSVLAVGPDGAPAPGIVGGQAAPLPAADPATFICLRGCRYLWQMLLHFDAGNPEATWDPVVGLRDVMQCPICKGRRGVMATPIVFVEGQGQLACDYAPTQGVFKDQRCRLVDDHDGPHHHAQHAPIAREVPCRRCQGKGVVPDPAGKPVKQPRRVVRSCLRQDGVDTDLNDTVVYECSEWDPVVDDLPDPARDHRDDRRRVYRAQHPEITLPASQE